MQFLYTVQQVPQSSQNPQKLQGKAASNSLNSPLPPYLIFVSLSALPFQARLQSRIISVAVILINNQFQPKRRMSTQHPAKDQPLNRREVYKNQKLQQINQIYYCECGKNYLTFSALYLHARNKHEVKLTTKRTSLNCNVQQKEDKTVITYFITQKASQQQVQSTPKSLKQNQQQQNQLFAQYGEVIALYLSQEGERRTRERKDRNAVIEQFSNYFQQLQEEGVEDVPTDIDKITLFFNDFISYYLPLAHQQKIITLYELSQSETELIRFWRWLRQNNYTSSQLLHRTYPAPLLRS